MNCRFITPRAQAWLANGRSLRILHLFAGVCNLVNEHGEVLSLVAPSVGPGPFFLVVEEEDFTAVLDANAPVCVEGAGRQLRIGPLLLETQTAVLWTPRPCWSRLQAFTGPDPMPLPPEIEVPLQTLLAGIQASDEAQIQAGTAGLAGRGPGLTPAGDDVLLGVIFALWVWGRGTSRGWMDLMVKTAVPRTTTLSAAFLQAAAGGEATQPWHDLADGVPGAMARLLAVGHSSGSDAWAGFARLHRLLGQTLC